jgi:hypothetical protein
MQARSQLAAPRTSTIPEYVFVGGAPHPGKFLTSARGVVPARANDARQKATWIFTIFDLVKKICFVKYSKYCRWKTEVHKVKRQCFKDLMQAVAWSSHT